MHTTPLYSYFFERVAALEYANRRAYLEQKRYRVTRMPNYDLFRWHVIATDIDIHAVEACS